MPVSAARTGRRFSILGRAVIATAVIAAPLTFAAVAPAQAQASRQHGDPSAESFVQAQASRALGILNDSSQGLGAKKRDFYALINQVADVPRITDFVLGRYRRALTPTQYSAFSDAFRDYADSVYESRLSAYHGETLKVTGSLVRQPGDVVVTSTIAGGQFKQPAVVLWRLLRGPAGWRVVDVQAQGVWLAVVEQQDFTSTLANNHGDIDVLIRQLRNGGASAATAKSG